MRSDSAPARTALRPLSKTALVQRIADLQADDISKRQVRAVLDALVVIAYEELQRRGIFLLPGLAKLTVVNKAPTKRRRGINPFTNRPTIFRAKPARRMVKARAIKAVRVAIAPQK
jgi:DNA-binding protein HU-beta